MQKYDANKDAKLGKEELDKGIAETIANSLIVSLMPEGVSMEHMDKIKQMLDKMEMEVPSPGNSDADKDGKLDKVSWSVIKKWSDSDQIRGYSEGIAAVWHRGGHDGGGPGQGRVCQQTGAGSYQQEAGTPYEDLNGEGCGEQFVTYNWCNWKLGPRIITRDLFIYFSFLIKSIISFHLLELIYF